MINISRAKQAWDIRLEGNENTQIAKTLSVSVEIIANIIKYTVADHYKAIKKNKTSYYDTNLFYLKSISNKKEKLKSLNKSIENKKKILKSMLIGTLAIVAAVILF